MASPTSSNIPGTLQTHSLFTLPYFPTVISEWAGLIPLVLHLTSRRLEYQLAGEAALCQGLSIGLFPKLGALQGIAKLLKGAAFLDRASAMSETVCTVWDVSWGSVFPCANGAAADIVTKYAIERSEAVVELPTRRASKSDDPGGGSAGSGSATSRFSATNKGSLGTNFPLGVPLITLGGQEPTVHRAVRPGQTLHVINLGRNPRDRLSWRDLSRVVISSLWFCVVVIIAQCGAAAAFALIQCYATAAILMAGSVSQIASRLIQFERSPGYLHDGEGHNACYLLAAHENAEEWYLYVGDRAVADHLLNKPMISIPSQPQSLLHQWFQAAHYLQILAMTYVAAEKGWDGVCMVLLMAIARICHLPFRNSFMAHSWLAQDGISVKAYSFRFGTRTQLICGVHMFNGNKDARWMDRIICPAPRRDVLLGELGCFPSPASVVEGLSQYDHDWVKYQADITSRAVEIMKSTIH